MIRRFCILVPAIAAGLIAQTPAPDMSVAYSLQADGNAIAVAEGATISFPATLISTASTATIIVLNRGNAPLELRSITLQGGSEFSAAGLPLLPGFLDSGREVRFTIRYAPRQSGAHSAGLSIVSATRTFTANLSGLAVGASFRYELIDGATTTTLVPNDPRALPDTALGSTSSYVVRVTNSGDGDGLITSINILGPGFQLSDLPFLPQILAPGSSLFFTMNFSPAQPGKATGRLRVANDTFEFSANGLGARLVYSILNGGSESTLTPGATINLPPTAVGQNSTLEFSVANRGTTTASISTIVTPSASEFTLSGLPNFPATLAPDQKITFIIRFTPNVTGPIASALQVDSQAFNLAGFGSPPPALPAYLFHGASGIVDPMQQPAVGLTLERPYPIAINGLLALSFTSASFSIDPALQFITGGTTVAFRIPANTTDAVFANGATQIRFQTGSVAGTIVITPAFATSGGVNLTPSSVQTLALTVPARVPAVLAVEFVRSAAANAFTLLVTGYSTPRRLASMTLEFTPRNGAAFASTSLTLDMDNVSALWYRGAASQNFGSLFTVSIPFALQGLPSGRAAADVIQSVSATFANEQGASSPLTQQVQ